MYGRTNNEQRFSPLSQINERNFGQLGLVWSKELGTNRGLEATPLVSNGVIYTTGAWSVAYALDARSGAILWTFDPKVSRGNVRAICCDFPMVESGGVLATGGNVIFQGRSDGIFCAYRSTNGEKLWQFDAGTGMMAPPVTYLLDGVQYITLMVCWGGSAGPLHPL